MSVTLDVFHDVMFLLKVVAWSNMPPMSVTLDVSQEDMSWLKAEAKLNI